MCGMKPIHAIAYSVLIIASCTTDTEHSHDINMFYMTHLNVQFR